MKTGIATILTVAMGGILLSQAPQARRSVKGKVDLGDYDFGG